MQLELGVLEEAEASGRSARIYYEQMQDRLGLAECHKVEGTIGREQTNYAEAEARLAQARQAFQALDNPLGVAECDLELGLVRQRRSDLPGARACWQGAFERFEQIGAVHQIRKAQTLLATLEARAAI